MSGQLTGKVAVVTGAGKGIGRAVTTRFVTEGATVVAVARTAADLDALAGEVSGPGQVIGRPGDITDRGFVEALFAAVADSPGRLDILVNNAGIAPSGSIFDMDPERFRACLELNLWAAFLCTQQAARLMRSAGGKIVNIGSVRSHWTEGGSAGAYNASKYGLRGFTESVARELHGSGHRIAVSLICPGVVDTPLTNPSRVARPDWLDPDDIARAVLHTVTAPLDVNVYDTIVIPLHQRPW